MFRAAVVNCKKSHNSKGQVQMMQESTCIDPMRFVLRRVTTRDTSRSAAEGNAATQDAESRTARGSRADVTKDGGSVILGGPELELVRIAWRRHSVGTAPPRRVWPGLYLSSLGEYCWRLRVNAAWMENCRAECRVSFFDP